MIKKENVIKTTVHADVSLPKEEITLKKPTPKNPDNKND